MLFSIREDARCGRDHGAACGGCARRPIKHSTTPQNLRFVISARAEINNSSNPISKPISKASPRMFRRFLAAPLANSRFHHCPDTHHKPASKLEAAYHRADKAIQQIVDLLAADLCVGNR
jgi:hypothetical protein